MLIGAYPAHIITSRITVCQWFLTGVRTSDGKSKVLYLNSSGLLTPWLEIGLPFFTGFTILLLLIDTDVLPAEKTGVVAVGEENALYEMRAS